MRRATMSAMRFRRFPEREGWWFVSRRLLQVRSKMKPAALLMAALATGGTGSGGQPGALQQLRIDEEESGAGRSSASNSSVPAEPKVECRRCSLPSGRIPMQSDSSSVKPFSVRRFSSAEELRDFCSPVRRPGHAFGLAGASLPGNQQGKKLPGAVSSRRRR